MYQKWNGTNNLNVVIIITSSKWHRLCFSSLLVGLSQGTLWEKWGDFMDPHMDKKHFQWELMVVTKIVENTNGFSWGWTCHKEQLVTFQEWGAARLFHAWQDCFMLLKLSMVEVCAPRVLFFRDSYSDDPLRSQILGHNCALNTVDRPHWIILIICCICKW